jgi:hypothetical protein
MTGSRRLGLRSCRRNPGDAGSARRIDASTRGSAFSGDADGLTCEKPTLRNGMRWPQPKEASMAKALVTLCCLLALETPVLADGAAALAETGVQGGYANAAIALNESVNEDSFQDLIQPVQWGGRTWTCWARSRRSGRTFSGSSRNANTARRVALNRCRSRSSACFITRCR